MTLFDRYIKGVRFLLPTPFTIAIALTLFTMVFAFFWPWENATNNIDGYGSKFSLILQYWNDGLWNINGLAFAIQMMLMLLLGHILALSPVVEKIILRLLPICSSNAKGAAFITIFTLMVSWFNWGLGLVFGAIFCKKLLEYAHDQKIPINVGLIGAAGYCGLMIWHGGISGSSLIKIAEPGHLASLTSSNLQEQVPNLIDFKSTVFSSMNLCVTLLLLFALPLTAYFLGKKVKTKIPDNYIKLPQQINATNLIGAEKLDHSILAGKILGSAIICFCVFLALQHPNTLSFQFITPNFLNLSLLGLALLSHGSFMNFLAASQKAIGGTVGILLQFPLYFGIMGIFQSTGIIQDLSHYFQSISTELTYPIYTFLSAGLVNFFVPSGGGQWYVQGPLVIQSALEMGIPLNKSIMALAYGDQLTNMMQPFWALPLLGITGLKAKDILPFTLVLMMVGMVIFLGGLILF
ncbi:MAG: short-chain fatty acid transporter [Crocinitomicaceae bacterium]|nr:short-chain fatty acid transporter [Crocinitomicaceae bacterium]